MSKDVRYCSRSTPLLGLILVLLLSCLATIPACEDLSHSSSPNASVDTSTEATQDAATTTAGATSTVTAGADETGKAEASSGDLGVDAPLYAATTVVSLNLPLPTVNISPVRPPVSPEILWTRYEEDDPRLVWSAIDHWRTAYSSLASGGAYRIQTWTGGVSFFFDGTRVRLIALKDSMYGRARLQMQMDGGMWFVDLYSPTPVAGTVWTSPVLAPGVHHLLIDARQAEPNPASTGEDMTFDAVEVFCGTLLSYEEAGY